jgi:hypothetical protein
MKRKICALCSVKRKDKETNLFFIVNCRKHFIPIVILKEHIAKLPPEQEVVIFEEIKKLYPKAKINKSLSDSDEHWHVHLDGVSVNGL